MNPSVSGTWRIPTRCDQLDEIFVPSMYEQISQSKSNAMDANGFSDKGKDFLLVALAC